MGLLKEVVPLLDEKSFLALPQAAFDVLVSISFTVPAAIVEVLPWAEVASWISQTGSPAWLTKENLTILSCGLLIANVLALPASISASEDEIEARRSMHEHLGSGNFLEFFVLAIHAAVSQQEWPAYSGAFHSDSRLAPLVS